MVLSLYFLFHQWELFVDAQGRRLFLRPEKFQFLEKGQNHNFDYKIVISVKKIQNLFSRSWMKKQISLLESSHKI